MTEEQNELMEEVKAFTNRAEAMGLSMSCFMVDKEILNQLDDAQMTMAMFKMYAMAAEGSITELLKERNNASRH